MSKLQTNRFTIKLYLPVLFIAKDGDCNMGAFHYITLYEKYYSIKIKLARNNNLLGIH